MIFLEIRVTLNCIWCCSGDLVKNVKYTFFTITPTPVPLQSGITYLNIIYGSYRSVKKLYVFDMTAINPLQKTNKHKANFKETIILYA